MQKTRKETQEKCGRKLRKNVRKEKKLEIKKDRCVLERLRNKTSSIKKQKSNGSPLERIILKNMQDDTTTWKEWRRDERKPIAGRANGGKRRRRGQKEGKEIE